jgi:hypothetical protein
VEVKSFDLRQAEPEINAAVQAFAEYAEHVPPTKSTRSKYGLLGPAGKAITELKSGRYDRDSLIGYTLRTQESARAGQWASELRLNAVSALEKAVDQILDVLRMAPEPYHSEILDRLDYGLYYRLRRRQIERKEVLRQEWTRFLKKKYGSSEVLRDAWKRDVPDFDALPLQKKQASKVQRRSEAEQKDIQEFYATRTALIPDEETIE